ncbi:MAG: hypothetical protein ABRQ37_25440, partial [Candidatus Eremiobacterota bacterium]
SSITTPTPAISDSTVGYLRVKIIWPQSGLQGKFTISSENNEKELTASMPADATRVVIKIRDINEEDPNKPFEHGSDSFDWYPGAQAVGTTIGPVPATKVIVRGETYNQSNLLTPVSANELEYQIKPGDPNDTNNAMDLDLGDYGLYFYGINPRAIKLGETSTVPALLLMDYFNPDETIGTHLANKEVTVTINSDNATFEDGKTTATGTTNSDGTFITKVTRNAPDDIYIEGVYKVIPDNPATYERTTGIIRETLPAEIWFDNFQSYTSESSHHWPDPNWLRDGAYSSLGYIAYLSPTGNNKSFMLYGDYETDSPGVAHRNFLEPWESFSDIQVFTLAVNPDINYSTEPEEIIRINLSTSPSWNPDDNALISFTQKESNYPDNKKFSITAPAITGTEVLGIFEEENDSNPWYQVYIQYIKKGADYEVMCQIDSDYGGQTIRTRKIISLPAGAAPGYLTLVSLEGNNYFDNAGTYKDESTHYRDYLIPVK